MESPLGGVKAHSGAFETHPDTLEAHSVAMHVFFLGLKIDKQQKILKLSAVLLLFLLCPSMLLEANVKLMRHSL